MSGLGTPPGWYPDPYDPRILRWWDGRAWSDATRMVDRPGPAPYSPVPFSPVPQLPAPGQHGDAGRVGPAMAAALAAEEGLSRWAVWYVVAFPVLGIFGGLELWADASGFKRLFHWFRIVVDNSGTAGYVAPPAPSLYQSGPAQALSVVVDVASLATLVLFVLYLVWQYRAAVVARGLGYPGHLSPGWGVGCWFVPIVDLWMPYQAIRDCLPPGSGVRAAVLRAWVLALVVQVISWATLATLIWARPVGLAFLVVLVAAEVLLAFWARQVVTGIGEDHRQAVIEGGPPEGPGKSAGSMAR